MSFNKSQKAKLLVECQRRCCVCHKYCGTKIEIHHVKFSSKGGGDNIENAIPLCFECHAEVVFYNPKHPKGNKFSEEELLGHKKQWLELCRESPQALMDSPKNRDIGPLEGMILELEFNLAAAKLAEGPFPDKRVGCILKFSQYEQAISEGAILLLPDSVKEKLNEAYLVIGRINTCVSMWISPSDTNAFHGATDRLILTLRESKGLISDALNSLKSFLNKNDS